MIKLCLIVTTLFLSFIPSFTKENGEKNSIPDKVEYVEVVGNISVSKSIQSITVVEKRKIEALNLKNLKEILSVSPGVLSLSNGKFGQNSSTFIRGAKNSQVLYLIDGVKIRDGSNIGGINLSLIPSFLIDKVEIVRGPLSSLYGSDAMGGVVNIVLNKRKGVKTLFSAGNFGSYQIDVSAAGKSDNLFYSFSSSIMDYRDNTDNDRFRNRGFSGKLDYSGKNSFKSGLLFFVNNSDSGIPYNTYGKPSPFRKFSNTNYMAALPFTLKLGESSLLKTTMSYTKNKYKFEDEEDIWSPYYGNSSDNLEIESVFKTELGRNINLNGGIDYSTAKIFSENSFGIEVDNVSRDYFSSFAKLDMDLGSIFFTTSLRFDKYKDVKSNFSPQLGLSFRINNRIKIKASYSNSFKAPLLIQQINPWGLSNFDLLPEKGDSIELGADIFLPGNTIGLSFFNTSFKNMIDWVTIDPVTWQGQYQNVKEASIKGAELSLSSSFIKNTRFDLSYTFIKSIDSSTGLPLKRRPKHTLSSSIMYRNHYFDLNLRMIYVGRRDDYDFTVYPPDIEMPSYNVYYLNINVPLYKKIDVFVKVSNLFNTNYSEIYGYPATLRRFEIGIIYN